MPPGARSAADHIVILALDTLGDLVLRQPLFTALLDCGHPVTVVAREGYEEILPYLDRRLRSLTIDINPHDAPGADAWRQLRAVADRIAALRPAVIVAAAHNRTFADEWIARQFPHCVSVGFVNPAKPSSLDIFDRMVDRSVDEHEAVKQHALFTAITGSATPLGPPRITLEASHLERATAVLRELGLQPGRYVFGCPAGTVTVPLKAWPPGQFAEIAAAIEQRHGLPMLVAGVRSEAPSLEAVAAAGRERGADLPVWIGEAGRLGVMLGLIAHSRAYLGNDSGPMHCAGALDVPVVARFGGGHWPRFLPLAARAFTATQKLPCFGCAWQCWLDHPACLSGVETQTILDGFEWLVSGSAAERRVDEGRPLDQHWVPLFESAEKSVRGRIDRGAPATPSTQSVTEPAARRLKVFVVTPSFNQGLYLRETIESVLAQDYPDVEYFVADGGSTDGSLDILRSYGDRVRWSSGPDGGQAAAIAKAWAAADADVVAWLNSDDTYLPGAISKAVDYLEEHPDAGMVYGEAWYVDASGRRLRRYPTKPFDREALRGECFICQPAAFVRRDVFKIVDLPDPALRYCMDYDLWIRISRHFHVDRMQAFLATSRLHLENKTLGEAGGLLLEGWQVSEKHFGTAHPKWKLAYADFLMRDALARLWRVPAWLRPLARQLEVWRLEDVPGPPFEDGWARRLTTVPVAADANGWMTIDVDFPVWPFEGLLHIAAIYEGRVCAVWRIGAPARFELTFRLPPDVPPDGSVLLASSQWFCPFQSGRSADPRVLSFMIADVKRGRVSTPESERRADRWNRIVGWLAPLPAPVQRTVLQACAPLVDQPLEVKLYDDGWAAPRTAVDVQAGPDGAVTMECESTVWTTERPLRITVSAPDGTVLATHTVEKAGRFELAFRLRGRTADRVLLEADQWFVPLRQGISEDPRFLSFRIHEVISGGTSQVVSEGTTLRRAEG